MSDTSEASTHAAIFDVERFREDVEINRSDLQRGFVEQASLFAFYAERHFQATRAEARAKMVMEVAEARAYKTARDRLTEEGVKATEKMIEAEVITDPGLLKSRLAFNEARAITTLAHGALEALRQRRDMLIQLGASEREEMKGDMRMRAPDMPGVFPKGALRG